MKKSHLRQLRKNLPNHPHTEGYTPYECWLRMNKPYCWTQETKHDNATAYVDVGYGYIALFENDVLIDASRNSFVMGKHYVVFGNDYEVKLFKEVNNNEGTSVEERNPEGR